MAAEQLPESAKLIKEFTEYYSTLCYNPKANLDAKQYLDSMKSILKTI